MRSTALRRVALVRRHPAARALLLRLPPAAEGLHGLKHRYGASLLNVSILIATYGSDEWRDLALSRALPSAEAQGAVEIMVGHQTDGTVASSRNGLAERATGEWLIYLDADDELGPGYVQAMQRALEQARGTDGIPPLLTPAVSKVTKGRIRPPRFDPIGDLRKNNFLYIGTMVNRDMFLEVGGFPDYPHGFEDWGLWAKCWKAGARVVQVKRAVYIQHINPNSKHREGWRDRKWQVAMHNKVAAELFPEGL